MAWQPWRGDVAPGHETGDQFFLGVFRWEEEAEKLPRSHHGWACPLHEDAKDRQLTESGEGDDKITPLAPLPLSTAGSARLLGVRKLLFVAVYAPVGCCPRGTSLAPLLTCSVISTRTSKSWGLGSRVCGAVRRCVWELLAALLGCISLSSIFACLVHRKCSTHTSAIYAASMFVFPAT